MIWSSYHVELVKKQALCSAKKYGRLCAHSSLEDPLQEMLIAIHRDAKLRFHAHEYDESLQVVEGSAVMVELDSNDVELRYALMPSIFFCRMPARRLHKLELMSEWFVFIERAPGPWKKENTKWQEPLKEAA